MGIALNRRGFTALWERGRIDLTVEAVVVEPLFAELFSAEEIAVARRHLEQFGYTPSAADNADIAQHRQ